MATAVPTREAPLPPEINGRKVAGFYFRRLNDAYLLTNDWGHHVRVSPKDFRRFLKGGLKRKEPLWQEFQSKGFVRDHMDFAQLAKGYREANAFLWKAPSLHILVATLRCNHKCVYCQSSAVKSSCADVDMDLETARAAVDAVFKSPSHDLTIEFQGGEPLLNWRVVRFAIRYARARSQVEQRNLLLALVTNMSLMDEGKLDFLLAHEVSLCTSLDGPKGLHDKNRIYLGGESHGHVARWVGELTRRYERAQSPERRVFRPSALMTTTRFSLPLWREIADEYVRLGFKDIFVRPLSPIGYAKRSWGKIGYSADEFVEFYRRILDHILQLNLDGKEIFERNAAILLTKILQRKDPGFVDLRSPCGAAVGQLAYDYDGNIYTCDEGRMVAQQGDDIFKVGSLRRHEYQDLIGSPACRVLCAASNLEGQPACGRCAYKPFCGVCPVHNYEAQGSVWGRMPAGDYCAIHKGIFDTLFERLEKPEYREVFERWLVPGGAGSDEAERQSEAA